ncbi:substrate-binding periplasmic protein [Pseudomonas knackmussii]|uniref:substrate-binding periplasmic protein n=1 Tax=Pseudomonas knackmussii TaxID=65741 RepID=UPI0038B5677D
MRLLRDFVPALFLAFLPAYLLACEKTLRWDDDPPFSMQLEDGSVGGIYVDLNRHVLERMGCRTILVKLPWARALKELENGHLDVLPGAFRKPEREVYAYFSGAIWKPSRNILFMRKELQAQYPLHDLLDLLSTSFRLGAQVGVAYGESYQQLMSHTDFAGRVFFNANRLNLWHMIDKERLDGIIADENSGLYELRQLGLSERIVATDVVVSSDASEVAFSKRSNTPEFADHYAQEMRAVVDSGEYQHIVDRYLGR